MSEQGNHTFTVENKPAIGVRPHGAGLYQHLCAMGRTRRLSNLVRLDAPDARTGQRLVRVRREHPPRDLRRGVVGKLSRLAAPTEQRQRGNTGKHAMTIQERFHGFPSFSPDSLPDRVGVKRDRRKKNSVSPQNHGFSSTITAASVDCTETLSPTLTSARLTYSLTLIVFVEPSDNWSVTVSAQSSMAVILAVNAVVPASAETACVPPGSRTRSLAESAPALAGTLFLPRNIASSSATETLTT